MPGTIECRRCRKTDSVRIETIVKANLIERHYDCAACGYSWTDIEDKVPAPAMPDRRRPEGERRRWPR